MMHQDAHEFLGWALNKVAEEAEELEKKLEEGKIEAHEGLPRRTELSGKTFIHTLFEGILTNETRCLTCETTSSRDESFLDLSIDIEQNSSVTACLRQFSASEMLCQKNKFFCEICCGLQEAEKRMKIKKLPNILALHLKRFKYQETTGRYMKLAYRVTFPLQLRLFNTSDDVEDPDRMYELFAVVIHIGLGPNQGHYVAIVRNQGRWVLCDDENVEPIAETDISRYFGDLPAGAGYVLFYQAVDLDLEALGVQKHSRPQTATEPPLSPKQPMTPAFFPGIELEETESNRSGGQPAVEADSVGYRSVVPPTDTNGRRRSSNTSMTNSPMPVIVPGSDGRRRQNSAGASDVSSVPPTRSYSQQQSSISPIKEANGKSGWFARKLKGSGSEESGRDEKKAKRTSYIQPQPSARPATSRSEGSALSADTVGRLERRPTESSMATSIAASGASLRQSTNGTSNSYHNKPSPSTNINSTFSSASLSATAASSLNNSQILSTRSASPAVKTNGFDVGSAPSSRASPAAVPAPKEEQKSSLTRRLSKSMVPGLKRTPSASVKNIFGRKSSGKQEGYDPVREN